MHVVNSSPVAQYLREQTTADVHELHVFRPELDLERLQSVAARRSRFTGAPRILFYARPNKPRNLFRIGMSALSLAGEELISRGVRAEFRTAGDSHPVPKTGPLKDARVLGKLAWGEYFTELQSSDILLSLQFSPHPSHPPLDAIVSGAYAVTNELGSARGNLHPRLIATAPTPEALADGLLGAIDKLAEGATPGVYTPEVLASLGRPMRDVAASVAEELERVL
jgi:hypothetical protein